MTSPTTAYSTAYTPLETLLLFQALRAEGANTYAIFNRVSDQLRSIPLIRSDPTFDQGRLSPDALRELYLWLLKEEVKRDLERQLEREVALQNGDAPPPGSRKRKVPNPSLPTVQEASQHSHLIPQLVTRLYTRYREHAVREIREHERRYDALVREIGEIEAGKWDERLQKQRTASVPRSPRPSTSAHTQPALQRHDHVLPAKSATASPVSTQNTLDITAQGPVKPYARSKIGDVINHEPQPEPNGHRRTSSNTTLPPLSEMAPQSPRFGIPPKIPAPMPTPMQGHNYNHSPPTVLQSPYTSHHGHPMASPQVQNSLSRPSSSPRPILPPPPGMKLPPPSPVQHSGSPSLRGPPLPHQPYPQPPPHRLSTGPSPVNERPTHGYAPPQMSPHAPGGYYQQPPYQDRRTSYPQPPQPHIQPGYPPTQPTHSGGYQLPPFSIELPENLQGRTTQPLIQQQYASMPQTATTQAQRPSYPQYSATAPATGPRQSSVSAPKAGIVSHIIAALGTPPRPQRNPTFKRPPHLQGQAGTPDPSPVTDIEPLSPVLWRSEPASKTTRSTRKRDAAEASEASAEPEPVPTRRTTRARQKGDRRSHSVLSSTADESVSAHVTRSHSVSTAGALPTSDDRSGSRGDIKAEPSPPAEREEETHEAPSTAGPMTRKRRGTLQSQPQPQPKRKRQQSPDPVELESGDVDAASPPPPRTNTVQATRNFHKLSATIMNDINSHKHASYFANVVRDKDAPGYSEIIKRPQHLKSIRTAVVAGTRAVNAAVATLETSSPSAAAADDFSTTVELERNLDLLPPRGIVNGKQLEKEVMRMFANAVLFNPGEDGMVSDTREMAGDIEAKIREWRGVEMEAEKGDDGGSVEEEDGKGKRRKLG